MKIQDEKPVRIIHACAFCGGHIDGEEVKIRTQDEGWLPYHPLCAPDQEAVLKPGTIRIKGGIWLVF